MKLNSLKPAKGSVKSRKRVARGVGAGTGRTATRGHKGAKSRSGYSSKRAFEGGQMPLQMRLPKRGFKNTHRRYKSSRPANFTTLNLNQLEYYANKFNLTEVSTQTLKDLKVLGKTDAVKVLANGELTKGLEVSAERFSQSAKEAITKAGGKAFVTLKLNQLQGIVDAEKSSKVTIETIAKYFDFIKADDSIAVVAEGTISQKMDLEVHKISDDAKAAVEAQGGLVTLI